jgi:2-keto-4-pentenoate hydratase/2-oxohepta-3-ene-1,7-dioic acid hydratase in catechol pathway
MKYSFCPLCQPTKIVCVGLNYVKHAQELKMPLPEEPILFLSFNDVTARDLQRIDGQWKRTKSFDTFAPFGPWIAKIDPSDADIQTRVNGKVMQKSNTSDLIFDVPRLVQFISGVMTLEQDDVIATGTPPGVGPLQRGDAVEWK